MKVNIRGVWYDAEVEPIQVQLTDADKKNITNMAPEAMNYISYPDKMLYEEVHAILNPPVKKVCPDCGNYGKITDEKTPLGWRVCPCHY